MASIRQLCSLYIWNGHHRLRLFLLLSGCIALLPRLPWPVQRMADDAFYYMKIAMNFWEYGYFTFDGVTRTNGVQPLWTFILTVLALPFSLLNAWTAFPYAVQALQFFLTLLVMQQLMTLLLKAGVNPWISMATSFMGICLWPLLAVSGMETVLVPVAVCFLFLYLMRVVSDETPFSCRAFAGLSLLVLMSRLDTGVLLLMVYAVLIPAIGFRNLFRAGLILILMSLPYFSFNYLTQGTIMPISGAVKLFWNELCLAEMGISLNESPLSVFTGDSLKANLLPIKAILTKGLETFYQPFTFGRLPVAWNATVYAREAAHHRAGLILAILSATVFIAAAFLLFRRKHERSPKILAFLFSASMLFLVFQLVYYEFFQHKFWEYYGGFGFCAFNTGLALAWLSGLHLLPKTFKRTITALLVAILAIHLGYTRYQTTRKTVKNFNRQHIHAHYLDLVESIQTHCPEEARIGSWAAGIIGYYSDRPVINLEGLVGDHDLLTENRSMQLAEYIAANNITYIAQRFHPKYLDIDVAYRRFGDAFAHIRCRPLIDYPEAYKVVDTIKTGRNTGYLFKVDIPALERLLANRTHIEKRIRSMATVIPAESCREKENWRKAVYIRDTNGFAITGEQLRYHVTPKPRQRILIYGRVYATRPEAAVIPLSVPGKTWSVPFTGDNQWETCLLTPEALPYDGAPIPVTFHKLLRNFDQRREPMGGVFIDELYIVSADLRNEAQTLFALQNSFTRRITATKTNNVTTQAPAP